MWTRRWMRTAGHCLAAMTALAAAPAIRAAVFDWDGGGSDANFSTGANWDGNSAPNTSDSANLMLPTSTGQTHCDYDSNAPSTLGFVTITGESPTRFILYVNGRDFKPSSLKMYDYAKLDIDQDVLVNPTGDTELHGDSAVDVASTSTCELEFTKVKGDNVAFDVTTAGSSFVSMVYLILDALGDDAHRRLKLTGGGKVVVDTSTQILSNMAAGVEDPYVAKLWVHDATLETAALQMQAGMATDRKIELDIDQNVTVNTKTTLANWYGTGVEGGGRIIVDIEHDKTLDVGELEIDGPCVLKVTGSFTGEQAAGKLETSAP